MIEETRIGVAKCFKLCPRTCLKLDSVGWTGGNASGNGKNAEILKLKLGGLLVSAKKNHLIQIPATGLKTGKRETVFENIKVFTCADGVTDRVRPGRQCCASSSGWTGNA